MKKVLLALAAVLTLCIADTALAGPQPDGTSQQVEMFPSDTQTDELRLEMLAQITEKEGFCNRPLKKLKPGEISVDWSRDSKGRCVVQTARQGR